MDLIEARKHRGPLRNQLGWLRLYAEFTENAIINRKRPKLALIHIKRLEDLLPKIKASIEELAKEEA